MSKEGTQFGHAVEKLVLAGNRVDIRVNPGHGQHKSTILVVDATGAVVVKFQAGDFTTLANELSEATRNKGDVTATTMALNTLDYMLKSGSEARFAALNEAGDLVINPDFDVPVFHRQRAAAERNGLRFGAAVVYDCATGEMARIAVATPKPKKAKG